MFTGLVQATGTVGELRPRGDGARLIVECPFAEDLDPGESVAVDGCCLTQLPGGGARLVADVSPQTLAVTTLGGWAAGRRVNLERALRASDRLGGHVVQGHVDGVVECLRAGAEGAGRRHRYALRPEDEAFVVPQGSVAVDGVSLTIAALGPGWFEVALVPHSLAETTLAEHGPGRRVNLELDVLGKYALRAAALADPSRVPEAARRRLGA